MGIYIIIILAVSFILVLGLRYVLICRELKHMQKELKEIEQDFSQNRILRQEVLLRETEPLTEEINRMIKKIRRLRTEDFKREKEFQEQIAQISHDLRTPLTSMIGYLRLMDQNNFSAEEKEDLAVIERKAQALQRLITQFYDYSRVRDEEFKLELIAVDAVRLLREKILDSWKELEERKLDIELVLPDKAVFILANTDALERVYTNLLQNAGRYAKTKIHVELHEEDEQIRIIWENDTEDFSGEGIRGSSQEEMAELEKLFERFYVKDAARTQGSSGLGLSIARRLTEKMGGTLTVRMPRGGWLQFELTLKCC